MIAARLRLAVPLEAVFADDPKMRIYVLCLRSMTFDLTSRDSRNQGASCFVIFLVFQSYHKNQQFRSIK